MSCAHYYAPTDGGDAAFAADSASVVFGRGALGEVGDLARAQGLSRVALFTDRGLRALPHPDRVEAALRAAGLEVAVYDEVRVEPDEASFLAAARFFRDGGFDGAVSVGGGSVIDTAKAALLYATYPADFRAYVNAPLGAGVAVPGPLPPHLACPTTCGTGSECTGIAVCELADDGSGAHVKTGIAHRRLRPTLAVVDPSCTATLPAQVVAASGFDVLCHALESFTARPYSRRPRPERPSLRPMSQGANPFSDVGCREALRLCGRFLLRAVRDAGDDEAREGLMLAASLAGIAFGNAGVHVPHGMGYAIAGQAHGFRLPGYPEEHPLVPHGLAVVLGAPAVFRFTAAACPGRHLEGAAALGADVRGATDADAGEVLAVHLHALLRQTGLPTSLRALGCGEADLPVLARGAAQQARLLQNAPLPVGDDELRRLFRAALDQDMEVRR